MFRIVRRLLQTLIAVLFLCMCSLCLCRGKSDDGNNGGLQSDNRGEWVNKL